MFTFPPSMSSFYMNAGRPWQAGVSCGSTVPLRTRYQRTTATLVDAGYYCPPRRLLTALVYRICEPDKY